MELETLDFDLRAHAGGCSRTAGPARPGERARVHLPHRSRACRRRCAAIPGGLRQILINLAGNAIKFTDQGRGRDAAACASETRRPTKSCASKSRDTGIGIPPDKLELLFNAFTQVDASTTRRYGGTGLGLAISKQLAELMGGEIGVESDEGRARSSGSRLSFARQHRTARRPGSAPPLPIRGVRVLVVDDNATNRLRLRRALQSWGVRS